MTIGHLRESRCNWIENADPDWAQDELFNIFRNDHIFPSENFKDLLVYVWSYWRDGRLNDSQAVNELQSLFEWLNQCSRAKPRTDFWRGIF